MIQMREIKLSEVEETLNYRVETRPVAVEIPCEWDDMTHVNEDGEPVRWIKQAGYVAPVPTDGRTQDQTYGFFSDGFRVHQPQEWLSESIKPLMDEGCMIGGCWVLDKGARAYVAVSLPESDKSIPGLVIQSQLLLHTSFDGSLATGWVLGNAIYFEGSGRDPMVVGGLRAAKPISGKVKHTKFSEARKQAFKDQVGSLQVEQMMFVATVQEYMDTALTAYQWQRTLDIMVPVPDEEGRARTIAENKRDALTALFHRNESGLNWWSAIITFAQWEIEHKPTRGQTTVTERMLTAAIKGESDAYNWQVLNALKAATS